MGELELRIAVIETFVIEVGGFTDPLVLADARRAVVDSLSHCNGDELAIKRGVIEFIDLALRRHAPENIPTFPLRSR